MIIVYQDVVIKVFYMLLKYILYNNKFILIVLNIGYNLEIILINTKDKECLI